MLRTICMLFVIAWSLSIAKAQDNPLRALVADRVAPTTPVRAPPPNFQAIHAPLPRFLVSRAPPPIVIEHKVKPTVKPTILSHNYRTTTHEEWCAMCLGQHLRNFHGNTYDELDKVGYKKWVVYHEGLHDKGVYKAPKDCADGSCSTSTVRGSRILRRFRR